MDMDRRKQFLAYALRITVAELEAMGEIEWVPLECEAKGYIDPRVEPYQADLIDYIEGLPDGEQPRAVTRPWAASFQSMAEFERMRWESIYQAAVARVAMNVMLEDQKDGGTA